MNPVSKTWLLPAVAALLLATGPLQAKPRQAAMAATVTIGVEDAYGQLRIDVDHGGNYQTAILTTAADGSQRDMAFSSRLGFDHQLPTTGGFDSVDASSASSHFSVDGVDVTLQQSLQPGHLPGSYLLTQQYTVSNPTKTAVTLVMSRYHDSDLRDDAGNVQDIGYIPGPGAWNYLLSSGTPSAEQLTTYAGINSTGGMMRRQVVRACCTWAFIPANQHRLVEGDTDGDHLSDGPRDRTLTGQRHLVVPPDGTSATFVTKTLLGRSALSSLSQLPGQFPTD